MFKIGEFSKLTQVSVRMLRYYDETGLLKPAKTDPLTGYRLYSAEQIPALNKILFLRDTGFQTAQITDAVKHWENDFITRQLEQKKSELHGIIREQQIKLAKIEQALQDIKKETLAIHYNVTLKNIPSYPVLALRRRVADYYEEGKLWQEIMRFTEQNRIATGSSSFSIYHDTDFREKDVDIEICMVVSALAADREGFTYRHTEAYETAACLMVYGGFENISGAFRSFAGWLAEHNRYQMIGGDRQIVHRGPWNEANPDDYLTEIQVPLRLRATK